MFINYRAVESPATSLKRAFGPTFCSLETLLTYYTSIVLCHSFHTAGCVPELEESCYSEDVSSA